MKTVETKSCPFCGRVHRIEITEEQYDKLVEGKMLIQNIFPNMDASIREMLITGICPDCWSKHVTEDEEI